MNPAAYVQSPYQRGPPVPLIGPPSQLTRNQIPQGSKLATYMSRGENYFTPPGGGGAIDEGPVSQLKKLSISGIPEFVPSRSSSQSSFLASAPGSASTFTPRDAAPSNSLADRNRSSPVASPTPSSTSLVMSSGGQQALTTEEAPGGNGEAEVALNSDPATAINTYNDGGTMYFYAGDEMIDPMANGGSHAVVSPTVLSANYVMFSGTPSYVAEMRLHSGVALPATVADSQVKMEILKRQSICLTQADPASNVELPSEVENFSNLCPLEPPNPSPIHKSYTFGYVTSVYKATNAKCGTHVCIRRVQNFRLVNSKCMVLVEQWRKLSNSNLVALRQVFTSKAFGDQSMLFVYDFYPGAETLMAKHFTGNSPVGNSLYCDSSSLSFPTEFASGKPQNLGSSTDWKSRPTQPPLTQNGLLPESLIWTYVIQLTSAIRHVHTSGLACRTLDPTKILVINKTRLLLNCCGMFDVLTFDPTASNPMTAMALYQHEDLIALGKIVLALACNSFLAVQRENLQTSMELVTTNYSSDMRTLIMYLLTNPNRVKSVNDLMPMIGARFYDSLDEANGIRDALETELSKDVESARHFRLITKLLTVVDRAELNGDASWSEYGDRYMLKLFRDYVFHQVVDDGRPWLDMAHVISCLNKFDAGAADKICLMSRDEQNVLVVSYSELKQCLERSYAECLQAAKPHNAPPYHGSASVSGGQGMVAVPLAHY